MTYEQARTKAVKLAMKKGTWVSVVCEDGDYDTATEAELDTFWIGAEPLLTYGPDGYLA